jgi:hypothetical protein
VHTRNEDGFYASLAKAIKRLTMKKILICLLIGSSLATAQNEWPLKPWVEVVGSDSLQQLGMDVSFLGKYGDSTRIAVSSIENNIRIYQMKFPNDTVPKYSIKARICALGDFNGDGYKDLVVCGDDVRIYLGSPDGNFDTIPFWIKNSYEQGDGFGYRVAIGKINSDPYDDLVVSAVGFAQQTGKVYAFFGGMNMDTIPDFAAQGENISAGFGWNVAAGDLNNDGFDDIVVRGYDSKSQIEIQRFCYVKVYLGGNAIDTVAWKYLKGNQNSLTGLACFDVNGDGIKDLLWTNRDSLNCIYVHYGGSHIDSIPNMLLKNPGVGNFGNAITNAGDMNGDGYDDVAVAAYRATTDGGFVFIFSGGPKMDDRFDAAAGIGGLSDFGYSVAAIGDVNGDGLADILVGAPQYKFNQYRGYWAILLGDRNIPVTNVKREKLTPPQVFELYQNYPNPFNPNTKISYTLNGKMKVTLKVYDALGRDVLTLINEDQSAGSHEIEFHASEYSSGSYLYELSAISSDGKTLTKTRTMTLIK